MKKKLFAVCCIVVVAVLASGFFLYFLPLGAERYIAAEIAEKIPFVRKELSLSRISPWRLSGRILIGDEGESGIEIPRFELAYSPAGLMQGRIDSLLIDSAAVHLEKKDGKVQLRGLQTKEKSPNQSGEFVLPPLPIGLKTIVLQNCRIVYQEKDRSYSSDFDAQLHLSYSDEAETGRLLQAVDGHLVSRINPAISGTFTAEATTAGYKALFDITMADLAETAALLPFMKDMAIEGSAGLQVNLELESLTRVSHYTAILEMHSLALQQAAVTFGNSKAGSPIILQIQGTPAKGEFRLDGLGLLQPEAGLLEFTGGYNLSAASIEGAVRLVPARTGAAVTLEYQAEVGAETTIDYQLKGEPFTSVDDVVLEAGFSGYGSVQVLPESFTGTLVGTVPRIEEKSRGIVLEGLSIMLPLHYPLLAPGLTVPGNLFIDEIHYQGVNSGAVKASIQLNSDGIVLNSQLTSPLHEDFDLSCSLSAAMERTFRLDCDLAELALDSADMPPFITLPEQLSFTGAVAAQGYYQVSGNNPSGRLQVELSDGTLIVNDNIFADINGKLDFNELPLLRSSPSQLITIGTMDLGKIKMSEARVNLRFDAIDTVFIEKARLNWCGGKVETGGFKLFPKMEQLETTLYCDRLSYTDLLDQFGVGDAEGDGSLNGRLPVIISRQGIEFDNGFLFSTPGNSGIVRFRNTEQLRQGMATMEGSPYLDYTMDALENFSYNWTKLTFNTEQSELLLTLQLDGKPSEPLPYAFEDGKIVTRPTGRGGRGLQHPIRLDVNFRLPLTELFRYGRNIQSFMENM